MEAAEHIALTNRNKAFQKVMGDLIVHLYGSPTGLDTARGKFATKARDHPFSSTDGPMGTFYSATNNSGGGP
jgi:hypothetical protein